MEKDIHLRVVINPPLRSLGAGLNPLSRGDLKTLPLKKEFPSAGGV